MLGHARASANGRADALELTRALRRKRNMRNSGDHESGREGERGSMNRGREGELGEETGGGGEQNRLEGVCRAR
eukprot:2750732-Pleurochrysis_carterae.AAC.1